MNANKIAAITQLLVMTLGAALHAPCHVRRRPRLRRDKYNIAPKIVITNHYPI